MGFCKGAAANHWVLRRERVKARTVLTMKREREVNEDRKEKPGWVVGYASQIKGCRQQVENRTGPDMPDMVKVVVGSWKGFLAVGSTWS